MPTLCRSSLTVFVILLALLLGLPGLSSGQNATPAAEAEKDIEMVKNVQKAPQELIKGGKIPVMITYNDMDSLGRRLVFTMRERLNASDLFRLSGYQEKKIKIVLATQEEFPGRPGLSSIYSLVWTFSYGEDVLSNYLANQVGTISKQGLEDLAETLVARTDEVYMKYSYLFEE